MNTQQCNTHTHTQHTRAHTAVSCRPGHQYIERWHKQKGNIRLEVVCILSFTVPVLAVGEVEGDHGVDQVRQQLLLLRWIQLHIDLQFPGIHTCMQDTQVYNTYKQQCSPPSALHQIYACIQYNTAPIPQHTYVLPCPLPAPYLSLVTFSSDPSLSKSPTPFTPPILLIPPPTTIQYLLSLSFLLLVVLH